MEINNITEQQPGQVEQHVNWQTPGKLQICRALSAVLEGERTKMADTLQEDIAQLIFIIQLKISKETAPEIKQELSVILCKIRSMAFELKPKILQQFGLHAGIQQLLNMRFNDQHHLHNLSLSQLPTGIGLEMETAIFRLLQQILNYLEMTALKDFQLAIKKTGDFIHFSCLIEIQLKPGSPAGNMFAAKLAKAIQPAAYLYNSEVMVKSNSAQQFEILIYLDQKQLR